jgi:sec-independent protein translocase protein TatC
MPIGPARMPFLEHIGELRKRLTIVAATLAILTIVLYFFTEPVFTFLIAPVKAYLGDGKPIALGLLDPMTVRFGLAFWASVVACSPLIIWQVAAFFMPALKEEERRWVTPTVLAIVGLFILGVVFCYLVILGPAAQWLSSQAGAVIRLTPTAQDTLTVVEFLLLGFGIAFQTPVVVFYLVYFGIVPYKVLRENWRFVYVGIVMISSAITPDWSPVTMGALSVAMIVLYEISLVLVRIMLAKRIRAREAAGDLD